MVTTTSDNYITQVTLSRNLPDKVLYTILRTAKGLSTEEWAQVGADVYTWLAEKVDEADLLMQVARNSSATSEDVLAVAKAITATSSRFSSSYMSVGDLLAASSTDLRQFPKVGHFKGAIKIAKATAASGGLNKSQLRRLASNVVHSQVPAASEKGVGQLLLDAEQFIAEKPLEEPLYQEVLAGILSSISDAAGIGSFLGDECVRVQGEILEHMLQEGMPLPVYPNFSHNLVRVFEHQPKALKKRFEGNIVWDTPLHEDKAQALFTTYLPSEKRLGIDLAPLRDELPLRLQDADLDDKSVQMALIRSGNVTLEVLENSPVRYAHARFFYATCAKVLSPELVRAIQDVIAEDPNARRKAVKTIIRLAKKRLK